MDLLKAEQLLTAVYDNYADAIFRHCYFRIHDRELAKDLMQQIFLKFWEYIQSGKTVENPRAFLYRTANNIVIDYVRKHKNRVTESLDELLELGFEPTGNESTAAMTESHFTEQSVHSVLSQVKEPYRTAVTMRYIDELSPVEIAQALKISVTNASVRINRGLGMLRSLLSPNG